MPRVLLVEAIPGPTRAARLNERNARSDPNPLRSAVSALHAH